MTNKKLELWVVVRNAKGVVIATYCNVLVIFFSQIEAELSTIWNVLKLCVDIGINDLIFGGHSKKITEVINCADDSWTHNKPIIENICI